MQVYVSSLTSTVQQLEQQIAGLGSSSTALSSNINLAFGNNAQQRGSNAEVQITTMYQVLQSSFCITLEPYAGSTCRFSAMRFYHCVS